MVFKNTLASSYVYEAHLQVSLRCSALGFNNIIESFINRPEQKSSKGVHGILLILIFGSIQYS